MAHRVLEGAHSSGQVVGTGTGKSRFRYEGLVKKRNERLMTTRAFCPTGILELLFDSSPTVTNYVALSTWVTNYCHEFQQSRQGHTIGSQGARDKGQQQKKKKKKKKREKKGGVFLTLD
jgi:hypothetical protein